MPESLVGLGVAALVFLIASNLVHEFRGRRPRNDVRRG